MALATFPNQFIKAQFGSCPNCKCGIYGTVEIAVRVGTAYMSNQRAELPITPSIVGATVDHSCGTSPEPLLAEGVDE